MGGIFEENTSLHKSKEGMRLDSKLLRKLRAKKVAQGHKEDDMKQGIRECRISKCRLKNKYKME
ncbi:MAG: hypothetical protein WCD89_25255 [Anaerocolumna sp.]